MRNSRIEVNLLSGAGGAEISGVDVSTDLDNETVTEIRDALNEHCVVFFRDQELDAEQQKTFARRFGELFVHPNYAGLGDDRHIVMVKREPGDRANVYAPVRPQQIVVRSMVREFVNRVFDGSARPLLVHLLKEKGLTDRERRELQKLLDKED